MEKRSDDSYEKKKQYNIKYSKEKYKRVPLDLPKEKYEQIKTVSSNLGETVNGFIKKAIEDRINNL